MAFIIFIFHIISVGAYDEIESFNHGDKVYILSNQKFPKGL